MKDYWFRAAMGDLILHAAVGAGCLSRGIRRGAYAIIDNNVVLLVFKNDQKSRKMFSLVYYK